MALHGSDTKEDQITILFKEALSNGELDDVDLGGGLAPSTIPSVPEVAPAEEAPEYVPLNIPQVDPVVSPYPRNYVTDQLAKNHTFPAIRQAILDSDRSEIETTNLLQDGIRDILLSPNFRDHSTEWGAEMLSRRGASDSDLETGRFMADKVLNYERYLAEADKMHQHMLDMVTREATTPAEVVAAQTNINMTFADILTDIDAFTTSNPKSKIKVELTSTKLAKDLGIALSASGFEAKVVRENGLTTVYIDKGDGAGYAPLDIPWYQAVAQDILAAKFEVALTAAATGAGVATGARIGKAFGVAGAGLGAVAGGTIAAGVASASGRGFDVYNNMVITKQNIDTAIIRDRMTDAGVAGMFLGIPVSSLAYSSLYLANKTLSLLKAGKEDAAWEVASKFTGRSKRELVQHYVNKQRDLRFSMDTSNNLMTTKGEKVLITALQDIRGGENFRAVAAKERPLASREALLKMNGAYDDLREALSELKNPTDVIDIITELDDYGQRISDTFGFVKSEGVRAVDAPLSGYTWDIDKLGVKDLAESLHSRMQDPAAPSEVVDFFNELKQYGNFTTRVVETKYRRKTPLSHKLAEKTVIEIHGNQLRTFDDLLELRQMFNAKLREPIFKKKFKTRTLLDIKDNIDKEIKKASIEATGDSRWYSHFEKANSNYRESKLLLENRFFKAIQSGGTSPKLVKAFDSFIGSQNTSWTQIAEKLSPKRISELESSYIDYKLNTSFQGDASQFKVVDWASLHTKIKDAKFFSPEARAMQNVVRIQNIYNSTDVGLHQSLVGGGIKAPAVILATTWIGRFMRYLTQETTNYSLRFVRTETGKIAATLAKVKRVYDFPTEEKGIRELLHEFRNSDKLEEIKSSIEDLQVAKVRLGTKNLIDLNTIYSAKGDSLAMAVSEGPLGRGIHYSAVPIEGGGKLQVYMAKIATEVDINDYLSEIPWVATIEDVKGNLRLFKALEAKGFEGVKFQKHVMLFDK